MGGIIYRLNRENVLETIFLVYYRYMVLYSVLLCEGCLFLRFLMFSLF